MSLPTPNTRKEQYLNAIATGNAGGLPTPITREEEYLDAIAKSGGGSGDGDMKKSVYDSDLDVAGAGGIKAFVNSAVAGKVDKVEGKGLSTNDYTDEDKAIVDGVTDALAEKADTDDIPDLVSDNLAKGILGNETVLSTDTVPFVSKVMSAGKYQRKKFVGCSFVWNQLVDSDTESVTIASGHKYALYQNGVWSIGVSDGTAIAVTGGSDLFTDLTQLFGSTAIADYLYNLETATAGAGVAKLKELGFFTEDYYAYDAGSIQSVDIKEYSVTGKNLFNISNASGVYNQGGTWFTESFSVSGTTVTFNQADNQKGLYLFLRKVKQGESYTISFNTISRSKWRVAFFEAMPIPGTSTSGTIIAADITSNYTTVIMPNDGYLYFSFYAENTAATIDKLQLELGSTATPYEPYHKTTYPLTPTELRGVPKIDANNNLYYDGDEYASDGGHTENYDICDLGTLTWTLLSSGRHSATVSEAKPASNTRIANAITSKYSVTTATSVGDLDMLFALGLNNQPTIIINDSALNGSTAEDFKTAMSGVYLVYEKATPTTETLTPFDFPQSVGSIEEITDYKVEQEDRDVAIPTGHVTEYMGKGGEFTLPTLPETPSVLAFDGHNFFWKPETA